LGHDVLSVAPDGRANQSVDDKDILGRATELQRILLTLNRWDFHRLHKSNPDHAGIVTCTDDIDRSALARRIDLAMRQHSDLRGRLTKVIRPNN
jgi:hypothetical protein